MLYYICEWYFTGNNKFSYQPGKTYEYQYEVLTNTAMQGAAEEKSELHLRATAHIEVISKCELSLSVSNRERQYFS